MQQVSFLLLYRIFPRSFMRGKNLVCHEKKTVMREKISRRCRTAGLERAGSAGRDGGPGRDGGRDGSRGRAGGGGGTFVFLYKNVHRNRLECCFGAEYRGKNPVIFYLIFSERYRIFPSFSRIFAEGKIRRLRGENPVLSPVHLARDSRAILR